MSVRIALGAPFCLRKFKYPATALLGMDSADSRVYDRNWYRLHRDHVIEQRQLRNTDYLKWYKGLKRGKSCVRCGESDPRCLDWHHLDPNDKLDSISTMISKHLSKKRILAEIAKCILLCANCHRKETIPEY